MVIIRMMKKGEVYQGMVERVEFPNKGFVTVEDRVAAVKGVVKGQKVSIRMKKVRKDKCQGMLVDVVEKSLLQNKESECPHFGICGGCFYQDMSYENQLAIKSDMVKNILKDVIHDAEFQGIQGSPMVNGYRNKMEFSFGDESKGGPLALGMHKKNSFHDIVVVDQCKIVHSDYNAILKATISFFQEKGNSFYHKLVHEGCLRHLVVRRAAVDGTLLINLVTSTQEVVDTKGYVECLLSLKLDGAIVGILQTKNDSLSDVVQSDETVLLYGREYLVEQILGLQFRISPFSFFQTNSKGAEVLYKQARTYILDEAQGEDAFRDKVIYDLYSGTGTIAQMMAPVAKKVIGVEIIAEAVEAAKKNAKLNGLNNCEFIAGDVLKVLDDMKERPDYIILDPPRDGIHPKALEKIIDYGVEQLIYISCKPTSLARDLEVFEARGYEPKKICCVDMFPGTVHVETIVLLSQRKADNHIEVDLDLDGLDVTSAESKATYNEIQQYVLKETGLMVSNLYIAQIKKKCGIDVGECFNKPKTENAKQPKCPEDKEKAIKDALKHFGMI